MSAGMHTYPEHIDTRILSSVTLLRRELESETYVLGEIRVVGRC